MTLSNRSGFAEGPMKKKKILVRETIGSSFADGGISISNGKDAVSKFCREDSYGFATA